MPTEAVDGMALSAVKQSDADLKTFSLLFSIRIDLLRL